MADLLHQPPRPSDRAYPRPPTPIGVDLPYGGLARPVSPPPERRATPPRPSGGSRAATATDGTGLPTLVGNLTRDLGDLMGAHVRLAAAELREEARQSARAALDLSVAAAAAGLCVLLLSFAAAWGLAEVIAPGLAFLVVALVYGVVAVVAFLMGRSRARTITPVPPETAHALQEDVQWLTNRSS